MSTAGIQEKGYEAWYSVASWCTDPICKIDELITRASIIDSAYPEACKVEKWARKSVLYLGTIPCAFVSFTSIFGAAIRYIANALKSQPFLYSPGMATEKPLTEELSLLSWNLCCIPAGYSIRNGGVGPWHFRINALIKAVKRPDADVVCLYEIFDIQTAQSLIEGLKDSYSHFYFNMGSHAIGLSSGLFIASKVKMTNPEFTPFPQEAKDGRAKYCNKGVFSFNIERQNERIARIYSSHFQHSENSDEPTQEEKEARKKEMDLILKGCEDETTIIVTGDLNLNDEEFKGSEWGEKFNRGEITGEGSTWGGNQFWAKIAGLPVSHPTTLDHTMIFRNDYEQPISTSFVETGFDGAVFNWKALSDHKGLLSKIALKHD